jgi:ribosomal 30S subunit maturation factor RimM
MHTSRFCFAAALLALVSVTSYAPAQVRAKAQVREEREKAPPVREEREVVPDRDEAAPDSANYRAKEILGAKVQIEGERSVGTVDDIVLDDHGNVDYLIVLTADKKLVTVPWDAAVFQPKQRVAKVAISQEKFEKVPTYTTEKYPAFTPQYRTQTYGYYGLTPGQTRRAIRRGAAVVR